MRLKAVRDFVYKGKRVADGELFDADERDVFVMTRAINPLATEQTEKPRRKYKRRDMVA